MRKKFWVILLTAIFFLTGAVLGVSVVYRVDLVTLEASLVSEEADAEAEILQDRLEEVYEKKSIFFAGDAEAKEVMKDFPYFRITGFEKSYPNRLIIKITEDAEIYAVERAEQGYYILGEDGMVLGVRDTHINPLTGAESVLIKGVTVTGENGAVPTGDEHFDGALALCKKLSALFGGIRSNIVSVEVFSRTPETIYRVTTREGVKIYFGAPTEQMEEKAEAAVNKYLSLTNEEKLSGRIVVSETAGRIFTSYAVKDEFES